MQDATDANFVVEVTQLVEDLSSIHDQVLKPAGGSGLGSIRDYFVKASDNQEALRFFLKEHPIVARLDFQIQVFVKEEYLKNHNINLPRRSLN